ncbi:hypothetical protein [Nocardia sp. NPDC059239]|uniref:hypothetical protein n=1 Tax=Nocardia sp. NPDC059239 TaxID=3346785 RepID=UPI0036AEAAE3
MGRPMLCPPAVLARVVSLHVAGHSDSAISTVFNREGVPTPAGGSRWQRCHVWRLRKTAAATRLLMFEGVVGEVVRAA